MLVTMAEDEDVADVLPLDHLSPLAAVDLCQTGLHINEGLTLGAGEVLCVFVHLHVQFAGRTSQICLLTGFDMGVAGGTNGSGMVVLS